LIGEDDMGKGWWASSDWLSASKYSQSAKPPMLPKGGAVKGNLVDIITAIFPAAAKGIYEPGPAAAAAAPAPAAPGTGMLDEEAMVREMHAIFSANFDNFEIKKHGPLTVSAWLPVPANVAELTGRKIDLNGGKPKWTR